MNNMITQLREHKTASRLDARKRRIKVIAGLIFNAVVLGVVASVGLILAAKSARPNTLDAELITLELVITPRDDASQFVIDMTNSFAKTQPMFGGDPATAAEDCLAHGDQIISFFCTSGRASFRNVPPAAPLRARIRGPPCL